MAVDDVSFDVARGEIVGFLGPNGAGKTTTLRVLACYLPATCGTVTVSGYDVFSHSLEVRRRIGYMPENVPLYPEMRVDEYLRYRAELKDVPRARLKARVGEVRALCGLEGVGRKIIGHLSKGYRQRVGLADALVHDPELLILDEPTIGFDPNQIRQVRELIRQLASRHTVLLSTHILPEAEMICGRVMILHRGRIVAADTPQALKELQRGTVSVVVEWRGARAEVLADLRALPEVREVTAEDAAEWTRVHLACVAGSDPRAAVAAAVAARRGTLRELHMEHGRLEDVFAALTCVDRAAEPAGGGAA